MVGNVENFPEIYDHEFEVNWISQVAWNSAATPDSSDADLNKVWAICFWDWSVIGLVGPQVHTQVPLQDQALTLPADQWELTAEYPQGPACDWRGLQHSWPWLVSTGDKGLLTSVKRHMGEQCGSGCAHQCKESHTFSEKGKGASQSFFIEGFIFLQQL